MKLEPILVLAFMLISYTIGYFIARNQYKRKASKSSIDKLEQAKELLIKANKHTQKYSKELEESNRLRRRLSETQEYFIDTLKENLKLKDEAVKLMKIIKQFNDRN